MVKFYFRSGKLLLTIILGFLLLSTASSNVYAQLAFKRTDAIEVIVDGNSLLYPWAGGFTNPQFSQAFLNDDTIPDLVIFDSGRLDTDNDHLLTFINEGIADSVSYVYAPEYEAYFPELNTWVLMRDFNGDGITDIIASGTNGSQNVDVYIGSRNVDTLSFQYKGSMVDNFGSFLKVLRLDIPELRDMNGDGDLDLLVFDFFFTAYLGYWENQSVELGLTPGDTLLYEQVEACYGSFAENSTSNQINFDIACPFKTSGRSGTPTGTPRHAGSSVTAFDEDGNGAIDLLIGDVSYGNVRRLLNDGTTVNGHAIAPDDSTFPSYNVPVDMPIFPATFYFDVNNDGKGDLIVAPNDPTIALDQNCIWYYQDTSSNDTVKFELQQKDLFMNNMIDLGTGSYPAFFDYNGDSLLDMVVGNYGYYKNDTTREAQLALFENIGTPELPVFELVERDYLQLSNVTIAGKKLVAIVPTFADIDGDNDLDFFFGDSTGTIKFYENIAAQPGDSAIFVLNTNNFGSIDVDAFSAPFFYDVNGDGVLDLLCGRSGATIQYFENRGTATSPQFDAVATNSRLGEIDLRVGGLSGYSNIYVGPIDTTGDVYILVGSINGRIAGYLPNVDSIYGGEFTKLFNTYSGIDVGARSSLAIADITNDGRPEMVVGSFSAGLQMFTQSDSIAAIVSVDELIDEHMEVQVYPNPFNNEVHISFSSTKPMDTAEIILYDLMGREHNSSVSIVNSISEVTINTTQLLPGIYVLEMRVGQSRSTHKIVKLK